MKPVTIRTRTVGQCFGTVGQLVRHGRVVAETERVYPYRFDSAAHAGALEIAVERGLDVVDSDGTLILRDGQAVRS